MGLRDRCKAILDKLRQDAILRQGSPVDDLMAFVVAETIGILPPRTMLSTSSRPCSRTALAPVVELGHTSWLGVRAGRVLKPLARPARGAQRSAAA
jgi:hypothetical protein